MLPVRCFFEFVVICIFVAIVESTGPLKNNHETLGITRAATFEDIQNAFQKLSKLFQDKHKEGDPPVPALVEIQHAYEAISNKDMQADALRFVDYYGYVTQLEDDMALRRFLEFQPSGSSRLRMAVVTGDSEDGDNMHFDVYATAVKFGHQVRVAQISKLSAVSPDGQDGDFIKSLKLHRTPAVVLMNPITRVHKERYILDGISSEVEKILDGDQRLDNKLGWLQEFDADAYSTQCQNPDAEVPCSSVFLFATSEAFEQRREDLVATTNTFNDACKVLLEERGGEAACFWLRRARATEWDNILQQKFPGASGDSIAVAVKKGPDQISLAPQSVIGGSAESVTAWFNGVIDGKETMQALTAWPALPRTLRTIDEPEEEMYSKLFRKALFHSACVFYAECRAKQKYEDELFLRFNVFLQQYGLQEYYVQLMGPQTDWTVVAGVAILILFFFFVTCKKCCCGRRGSKKKSEEEACETAEFFFTVKLAKTQAGDKLGMDLTPHTSGGVKINTIDDGHLIDRSNRSESRPERRIRPGDRIALASGVVNGKQISAGSKDGMLPILKGMESTLIIARQVWSSKDATTHRLVGTCNLEGIPFHGNVQLGPVEGGGPNDIEIKSLGPALLQWNQTKTQQGACCTQCLEVGDRIISVANNTNVLVPPTEAPQPLPVLFVRWRTANSVKSHTTEINMERTPDERWGMQIRTRICEPKQLEILDVVAGGLAAKWNSNPSNPQILKGDRIASVGGKTDKEGIHNGLRETKVAICFERWIDGSAAFDSAPSPPGMERLSTGDLLKEQAQFQAANTAPTVAAPAPAMPAPPQFPTQPPSQAMPAPPIPQPAKAPQPPKAPATSRMVASPAAPVAVSGNPFPWLPVLSTMAIGTAALIGGLSGGESNVGLIKKQIPAEAQTYLSKINAELYPEVAAVLLLLGFGIAVNFIRNEFLENYSPGCGAGVLQQLCGAALASTFLGFGSFVLLVWSGVYVSVQA